MYLKSRQLNISLLVCPPLFLLGFLWKEWCLSWNSSTLATSCEELTCWKRFWCWEGLGARGEGDDRGWDGWMASLTRWTWVWVISGSWWWTGRPGVLRFMGSQRVGHDWATELNWTEHIVVVGYISVLKVNFRVPLRLPVCFTDLELIMDWDELSLFLREK